jgi:hypothetical protein
VARVGGRIKIGLSSIFRLASPQDRSDAPLAFMTMATEGMALALPKWTAGYIVTRRTAKLSASAVYLPTFASLRSKLITTGSKINGIPLKVGFGGPWLPDKKYYAHQSMGGLGLEMDGEHSLLRMDWHKLSPTHGGAAGVQAGEIKVIERPPYHMHV